jgi:hypothetical protein
VRGSSSQSIKYQRIPPPLVSSAVISLIGHSISSKAALFLCVRTLLFWELEEFGRSGDDSTSGLRLFGLVRRSFLTRWSSGSI